MIIHGNSRSDLDKVPPGGTFCIDGVWNCSKEGPIYISKPIHICGDGGMKIGGTPGNARFGSGSFINNSHESAEEAIYFDIPHEIETQGICVSGLSIRHAAKNHYAVRTRSMPASILSDMHIDCRYGLGGLFYDEFSFFMTARNVVIKDFTGIGVNIVGNGNDFTFYNCDIGSRRKPNAENTATAGIHCVNSGLNIHHGCIEAQNDDYSGVGVRLFYDRILRPASGGNALIFGMYTENGDIAIQIDATDGYQWDKANILYPHWTIQQQHKLTRGVDVIRGKNIYIESPQVYDWSQADDKMVVFREGATNCLLSDKTHDLTGKYTDMGERNRILSNNV